jgi:hypothetical protein
MESMGYVHHNTEVYYTILNLSHKVCDGSGEDPTCADGNLLPLDPLDHGLYLSTDFMKQFLACQLYSQEAEFAAAAAAAPALQQGVSVASVIAARSRLQQAAMMKLQEFPAQEMASFAAQKVQADRAALQQPALAAPAIALA